MSEPSLSLRVRVARFMFGRKYRTLKALRGRESSGYSLVPFDRHRCIFVHIPKAAGVSVSRKLFGCLGGGHTPIADYANVFSPDEFRDYFKFTFVRNPWDRLLSAYTFLKRGGFNHEDARWARKHLDVYSTFQDFVKGWVTDKNIWTQQHFYPQSYFVTLDGRLAVDFVGRFESIDSDFRSVSARLGVAGPLEHLNSSGTKNYADYYDKECAEIVRQVYREDVALFDYRF